MLLIKFINENKSLNEISSIMNLSKKQLFQKMSMLRQSGYLINKKYYYNGDIRYYFENPFEIPKINSLTIETPNNIKSLRLLLTSDSHFGNVKENLECTYQMFEHCIKENINLIFHLGDFFEGVNFNSGNTRIYNDPQEQIQKSLSRYPLVDNILTITLLGNHDSSFWLDAGIDIKTVLENKRHDIIPVGYKQGRVKVGNYYFILKHQISKVNLKSAEYDPNYSKIFLHGHSHRFKLISENSKLNIFVPSSSNMVDDQRENSNFLGTGIPSVIDVELIIEDDKITSGYFKQYILLNNRLIKIGEHVTVNKIKETKKTKKDKSILKPSMYMYQLKEEDRDYEENIEEKSKILSLKNQY